MGAALSIVLGLLGSAPGAIAGLAALEQSGSERALLSELETYRIFARDHNATGRTAVQVNVAKLSASLSPRLQRLLPPVWSCRTPWQCDLAVALVERELQ